MVTAEPALQQEVLSGFTRERTRVVLSTEVSGRVEKVNGDVGDITEASQPFVCLDQTFIDLELDVNRQKRKGSQVDYNYFDKEVERIRQLLTKKSSSESQLDAALRNLDKTSVQLAAQEIDKRILQEKKARHCINTPEGWRIISRHVEVGEWINAGEPVVEIGDYRRLRVPFALNVEEYHALQRLGDGLRLNLPQQGREVPATLLRVSPAFDEASHKIAVELEISGIDDSRGGLRAELALEIPFNSGAVMLPESALLQRYEQYWLKRSDGEEVRVVYLGREQGPQGSVVHVVSPEVKPGDSFQSRPE
jgi:RND family efflux transporter MFP subunit